MLTVEFQIFFGVVERPKDSVNRFRATTFTVVTDSPQLSVPIHRTSPKLGWLMHRFAEVKEVKRISLLMAVCLR